MSELFLTVLNRSISAGWVVLAVLILRLVLKKAPRWPHVLLWGLVALRLVLPGSVESVLSLIPSAETIPMDIGIEVAPAIDSGIHTLDRVVNPAIAQSFTPRPEDSANPLQIWVFVASVVWVAGVAGMLLYAVGSSWRLRRRVRTAVWERDNIFRGETVPAPFVMGLFRPRIYLPYHMDEEAVPYVVAHEQAHIRRRDPLWKFLAFVLLAFHWFNPLLWLAVVLLYRDLELACDERVIRNLDGGQRADYTQALLSCSVHRRRAAACPLAFGEVGVKERVKSVLQYRKPAFWMIVLAVIVCTAAAVCFLTDPVKAADASPETAAVSQDDDTQAGRLDDRMALVDAEEIRSISSWSDNVEAEPLATALNGAAGSRVEDAEELRGYYNLTAYLSGGPEGYSGEEEHFTIYAGLEEDVLCIQYSNGSGTVETGYYADGDLYRLLRDSYQTGDEIDPIPYETWGGILEARAQATVDGTEDMWGEPAFTGYEVTRFGLVDELETDGIPYDVYAWDAAFLTDDPDAVVWAGGMWLDAEGRVRAVEQETYLAIRPDTGEYRFISWDLYDGADAASGRENVERLIAQAFAQS